MCTKANVNDVFKSYAEYLSIKKQAENELNKLKTEIIEFLESENIDSFIGVEHKATYKTIESDRFNSSEFKKDFPDVYNAYKEKSTSTRFNFN